MQANTDPNGRRYYRCRRKKVELPGSCSMPNLPQRLVDEAVLSFLSKHVISQGLTTGELEAELTRAVKDAATAKSEAERAIRQADEREASAELKWIDGKIDDRRWAELQARFDAEREQARTAAKTAEVTLEALAQPDEEAITAVERLRADLQAAATDEPSLPRYHALIGKLFEHVEVLEADADAPEQVEDFPTTPTFVYEARQATKGRPRAHRYYLLPVLRPELAMLYGGDPIKFAGAGDLIDRNAWAWHASKPARRGALSEAQRAGRRLSVMRRLPARSPGGPHAWPLARRGRAHLLPPCSVPRLRRSRQGAGAP
jgi:hypothetical protein